MTDPLGLLLDPGPPTRHDPVEERAHDHQPKADQPKADSHTDQLKDPAPQGDANSEQGDPAGREINRHDSPYQRHAIDVYNGVPRVNRYPYLKHHDPCARRDG